MEGKNKRKNVSYIRVQLICKRYIVYLYIYIHSFRCIDHYGDYWTVSGTNDFVVEEFAEVIERHLIRREEKKDTRHCLTLS